MNDYLFPSGSEWRKWDLHAHTPLDMDWVGGPRLLSERDKIIFAEQYVAAAIKAGLSVIAITDHNFCDDLDELLIPYIADAAKPHGLMILPGFEVTVSDGGGTHVLVIFSEETPLVKIDGIVAQLFPPGCDRFKEKNVCASDKNIEVLNNVLQKSSLKYLILFAHADRENGVLQTKRGELRSRLWKQPFVRIAQLSKPPSEQNGFIAEVVNTTNPTYARDMTYIVASDCRGLDSEALPQERCALGERFTWIKADPTFEGLKQIIFEPNDRIRFQEHKPEAKPLSHTISQVRFVDSTGLFQSDPIPLNQNLVTIIGGKSTGKSILLSCIARAVDVKQVDEATAIAGTNQYVFDDLDFEVTWSNGDVDNLSDNNVHHRITFLPQMYIHSLVEREKRQSLSDYLLNFLRQKEEFDANYRNLMKEHDDIMMNTATEISTFFSHLLLWRDIVEKMKELGDQNTIDDELKRIDEKAEKLRIASGFSDEETAQYKRIQQDLINSTDDFKAARRVEAAIGYIISETPPIIRDVLTNIDEFVDEVSDIHQLRDDETRQIKTHTDELKKTIDNAYTTFTGNIEQLYNSLSKNTAIKSQAITAAESALMPFKNKISNQKELLELQELRKQFVSLRDKINKLNREKKQIEQKYSASLRELKDQIFYCYTIHEQLIKLFNNPIYARVGNDITINAELIFDEDKFQSNFLGCFDMRHSLTWLGDQYQNNVVNWSRDGHVDLIVGTLDSIIKTPEKDMRLRLGQNKQNVVESLLRDYLSHRFSVRQNDEDIFRMSPGKQGLVLLEIFLHLNNSIYPILIDQPEDNLDNRTIYSHLVKYIRARKLKRQIIMVTHNPNLVLGADAEQVIVANQSGEGEEKNSQYRFEYVSGSIECSFAKPDAESVLKSRGIREHVCHILEGGEDAFRKREEKYCLT